jgi:cell wall-associated NlpC family hydrolase
MVRGRRRIRGRAGRPDTDLPDLTGLTPIGGEWDLPSLNADLDEAETAEAVARAAYDAASLSADRAEDRYTALDTEFDSAQRELDELIEDNRDELEELENDRETAAAQYSDDFSSEVDGWDAAPEAKKAVEYALAQLGDPYVWGAEGPDSFDCSGLVQSAYAYAGVSLPRVANDQFNATRDKPVDTEKLLPGDLLYWWDDPGNWQSVYHTGMYLGGGKMVVAPRTGDVVKISSIWFDNFAGAHRVVDAVKTDPDAENPTQSPGGDDETNEPEPTQPNAHRRPGHAVPDHLAEPSRRVRDAHRGRAADAGAHDRRRRFGRHDARSRIVRKLPGSGKALTGRPRMMARWLLSCPIDDAPTPRRPRGRKQL